MKRRIEKAVVLRERGRWARASRRISRMRGCRVFCWTLCRRAWRRMRLRKRVTRLYARVWMALGNQSRRRFSRRGLADRIAVGNFDDDLARCAEADWIIEVVAENLEIKKNLLARVAQFCKPGAIVTTNTSRIRRSHLIAEGLPEEFQQHWAGTHFFNPPRYLKLVELIPGPKTSPEVIESLREFCDRRLGKGVVVGKDTPNFIANRIGTFSILNALRLMGSLGLTVEEVDACTGPVIGQPKSATFRTADIVGLDVLVHVVKNVYETVPNDESREMFRVPALIEEMAGRKWLGDKTGQGFYKKVKGEGEKEILTLDVNTMELSRAGAERRASRRWNRRRGLRIRPSGYGR